MKTDKILHLFSFLAYPLLLGAIYFLYIGLVADNKAVRIEQINQVLILVGFAIGLATLKKKSKKHEVPENLKIIIKVHIIITVVLLVLFILVLIKDQFQFNKSVAIGLLSIIVGELGNIKAMADSTVDQD